MTQLVVISDSHGRDEVFHELHALYPQAAAYLHCGDSEAYANQIVPFLSVEGNNDRFYDHPIERFLTIDGVKIWMIHSHQYPVVLALERLKAKARELQVDLVLYGHSHIYKVIREDSITFVNPGSIHYNRDGSKPCFALITLDQGQVQVERIPYPRKTKTKRWF